MNIKDEIKSDYNIATIVSILSYQAGITAQGYSYNGTKDWALNKILDWHTQSLISLIRSEIERKEGMMKVEFPEYIKMGRWKTHTDEGYNTAIAEDIEYWKQVLLDLEK